jgi:hypothetical protein
VERDRGHGGRGAVWSSGKCGRRSSGATRATQESLDRENDVRYDFVHTVTHRRLLTETNKSPAAIGRPGMIASRYERDQQNQLLGRRRAFRVLCRSDLLSGSMIAFVVRSEVLTPCAVYAGTLPCQADAHRLIRSVPEAAPCCREEKVREGGQDYCWSLRYERSSGNGAHDGQGTSICEDRNAAVAHTLAEARRL